MTAESFEFRYLTCKELAERWSMAPGTLRNWRVFGWGPEHFKRGMTALYPLKGPNGIEAWEKKLTRKSTVG